MNKQAPNSALIGLLLVTLVNQASAQGSAFTYQGHLTVATTPANGNFDLTFTLYDAITAGNIVAGPLTNASVAVSNGLFTTVLDFGNSAFNGTDRWLQISVGTNGSGTFFDLAPLQKLTAAPYSIYSANASVAGTANAVAPGTVTGSGIALNTIAAGNIASGQVVKTLNGLTDAITLSAGTNVTLTSAGNNIQISSVGTGWNLVGNAGTGPGTNFLGTTDNAALELKVNNHRALRLEPTASSPNVIAGFEGNYAISNAIGTVIGGGGSVGQNNLVDFAAIWPPNTPGIASYDTIGGGAANRILGSSYTTIAGGIGNIASAGGYRGMDNNTIGGGTGNALFQAAASTIGGGVDNGIRGDQVSYSTICGGAGNSINSSFEWTTAVTIGGGTTNSVDRVCNNSTIAGGGNNSIGSWSPSATIGGGGGNNISSYAGQSVIAGGVINKIDVDWVASVIGGGYANQVIGAAPTYPTLPCAVIAGGQSNIVSAAYGAVLGGQNNTTSGTNGVIAGGQNNIVRSSYGTIPGGLRAATTNYGQLAYASGAFTKAGDAQTSTYVCRCTTTNASATELFLDASSMRIGVPTNSTWTFDALITGRTATGDSAGYQIRGVVKNNSGATTIVGTTNFVTLAEDVPGAWNATVAADSAHQALVVTVTGADASTIRWVASVRTTEVGY